MLNVEANSLNVVALTKSRSELAKYFVAGSS